MTNVLKDWGWVVASILAIISFVSVSGVKNDIQDLTKIVSGLHAGATLGSGPFTTLTNLAIAPNETTDGFLVGTSTASSVNTFHRISSCVLNVGTATVAATTTKAFDCPFTGAYPGDFVQAWQATSTVATTTTGGGSALGGTNPWSGWIISWSVASGTPNFVTIGLSNLTGAAAYPPTIIASSTKAEVDRMLSGG